MTTLLDALAQVRNAQQSTGKPLAIIVAGHNGSGKSTMWRQHLSPVLEMPLLNADRLALAIYPEPDAKGFLPAWASQMRDNDPDWMRVTQQGVVSFTGLAMARKVPFAMETVFSDDRIVDGVRVTKIDLIRDMQANGYVVLLFFVGLANAGLSVLRVSTRVAQGGHGIPVDTLQKRFPRTQGIISEAALVADATIMTDNSRGQTDAFTVCRVQLKDRKLYDLRDGRKAVPPAITEWMQVVAPHG